MPIVIAEEGLGNRGGSISQYDWRFIRRDNDVFSDLGADAASSAVVGSILVTSAAGTVSVNDFGKPEDRVRVVARWPQVDHDLRPAGVSPSHWVVRGYVRQDGVWQKTPVIVVPVRQELYSRTRGLIETDILAGMRVLIVGQGSMGSVVSVLLVQSGVAKFILMDHDRVECVNVVRHVAGVSDLGRLKARVVADQLYEKNPYAEVEVLSEKVTWQSQDLVRRCVRRSDLAICLVDDMEARVIVNEICVKERKPLIEAGAYRRAYGGQVHVVQPGMSPCYQCFLMAFPGMAQDQEIASQDQADRMAYSDRLLTAEPGLANDIAPINHMVVKLALQRLLVGKPTAMRCLDEDLVAPFYIWLNRREPGTDYERLGPLQFNVDGLRILRWYGVRFDRNAACPCCGDFIGKGGNVGDLHADAKYLDMCKEPDQK